jgi:DNA-binding NtrC family response regulator
MAELVIVDDDPDNLQILTEIMTTAGHQVRTGNNGEEGIQRIHEDPPDLAILDVEMPQLTGPGVAYRMFVEDTGLEQIPVVLLSGIVNLHEVAARVGTPYFLGKPFHVDALLRMVKRALAERVAPRPQHPQADPPAALT